MTKPRAALILALSLSLPGMTLPLMAGAQNYTLSMPIAADLERQQISVTVNPGVTSTAKLKTSALREARKAMIAGAEIPDADLRALADAGDGLAAQRYVRRLKDQGLAAANPSDVAYYGSIAVAAGRIWTLRDAVEAMRRLDPETEPADRKRAHMAMLYPHAWAGNSLALDALIDLNGDGKLFGKMSEDTRRKILEQGAKNGDGRAALRMALDLLQKADRTEAEQANLRDYLAQAAQADNLAVQTTSANILAMLDGDATGTPRTQ